MTIEQYLYRLCRNILNERFDWCKYLTTRSYFGRDLCVTPLHVSYGQIGYTIHFPYSRDPMPEIAYDWEMNDLTIDEEDWQNGSLPMMKKIAKTMTHPKNEKSKMPTHYYICAHLGFLILQKITRLSTECRPCNLFLFYLFLAS